MPMIHIGITTTAEIGSTAQPHRVNDRMMLDGLRGVPFVNGGSAMQVAPMGICMRWRGG